MKPLPASEDALVLRTDFGDDGAWWELCKAMTAPVGGFRAHVEFANDVAFDRIAVEDIVLLAQASDQYRSFLFVVDRTTFAHAHRPILVVDLNAQPGRTFRVVPAALWGVENNLSLANMDFEEFLDGLDADGIFRGFGDD